MLVSLREGRPHLCLSGGAGREPGVASLRRCGKGPAKHTSSLSSSGASDIRPTNEHWLELKWESS